MCIWKSTIFYKALFNGHFPFSSVARLWTRYNGISSKFVATSRRWSSNVKMIQLRLVTGHWASHLSMNTTLGRSLWVMWWHCHQGIFHWLTFLKKYVNLTAVRDLLSVGALIKKLMTIMSENHPGMLHQNNWFCFVQFNCAISPCLDI